MYPSLPCFVILELIPVNISFFLAAGIMLGFVSRGYRKNTLRHGRRNGSCMLYSLVSFTDTTVVPPLPAVCGRHSDAHLKESFAGITVGGFILSNPVSLAADQL